MERRETKSGRDSGRSRPQTLWINGYPVSPAIAANWDRALIEKAIGIINAQFPERRGILPGREGSLLTGVLQRMAEEQREKDEESKLPSEADLLRRHGEERVKQAQALIHELTVCRPLPKNPQATLQWFLEGEGAPLVGQPVNPVRGRYLTVDGCVIGCDLLRSFDMHQIRAAIARQVAAGKKPKHESIEVELRGLAARESSKARMAARARELAAIDVRPPDLLQGEIVDGMPRAED